LTGKRRVGEHLLVTGHARDKDNFTEGSCLSTESIATVHSAVFQDEHSFTVHIGSTQNKTPCAGWARGKKIATDSKPGAQQYAIIFSFPASLDWFKDCYQYILFNNGCKIEPEFGFLSTI
jgi:hypothetical protein